ncbi:hypothetical protein [Gellertiella hungarica]|uniref:Glycosyl transferase family 2 n=1 Tax=Gellertiella hungarica TaxID=1572859 RepID=A0A7W6J384_9HYPH|nr:hypothetical protein [Gellertiella hungarica]MBB4063944.1 hypothetical protein [Gellertiella hungarica]
MTTLSICIPVEPGMKPPLYLCERLLSDAAADIEVIVAPYGEAYGDDHPLLALAGRDARLRILPPAPENISLSNLWMGTVAAMTARWVTVVRPDDMLEPGIDYLLRHVEETMPDADACGWNTFTIDPNADRNIPTAVAVPIQHHVTEFGKTEMLEAFFHWKDSLNVPKMPFGLYHCAISRSLLEAVLVHSGELSWLTPVPQYEWSARVVLHANRFAFASRPLSAISQETYKPVSMPRVITNFPFTPALGITAAIAEIQCRVLHDIGSAWDGYGDDFVRACMIDCMLEHREQEFESKCQAYHAAMREMGDQRLAASFHPPYMPEPKADRRRGLHGRVLLVDRFLGNATTAQDFYEFARFMLTPLPIATSMSMTQH